jgi:hypothetical protein
MCSGVEGFCTAFLSLVAMRRKARGILSFAIGYLGKRRLEGIVRPGVAIGVMALCALKKSIRGAEPAFSRRSLLVLQQSDANCRDGGANRSGRG